MKIKALLFFLMVSLFALSSCDKKSQSDIGFEIGQSFNLAHDQTAFSSDGQIEVHFTKVQSDSRCPSDVDCFWEGESTVVLDVKVNSLSEQIKLSTHVDFGKRDTVSQLVFTLLDVLPYPCCADQEIDEDDYVVELIVEEL